MAETPIEGSSEQALKVPTGSGSAFHLNSVNPSVSSLTQPAITASWDMAEPTFEGLPIELKILILCEIPDCNTLKSLLLASPGYHGSYLAAKEKTLGCLVKREYDGFVDIAEALTVVRSESLHFTLQREKAISLLDKWRRRDEIRELHRSSSPNPIEEPAGLEEILKLFHFHKILRFFLEDFSINAPRPPWIQPAEWKTHHLPLHLSLAEKHRFLKAVCRLQIVMNIFGDPISCVKDKNWHPPRIEKCWQMDETTELIDFQEDDEYGTPEERGFRLFYGTMPPWAHEEMGSVLGYFVSKIEVVVDEISENLRRLCKSTPCEWFWDILPVEERPPSCCEIDLERDLVSFHQHFEGIAGLGPEFLYDVFHMDRPTRRDVICSQKTGFWGGPFIGLGLGFSRSEHFPYTDPADGLDAPHFEEVWSTLPPLEQPTLGWRKAWLRPYREEDELDLAMSDRQSQTDWEWSYALWDDSRLKEWKAPLLELEHPHRRQWSPDPI